MATPDMAAPDKAPDVAAPDVAPDGRDGPGAADPDVGRLDGHNDGGAASIPGCANCAADELCVVYLDGTCLRFAPGRCAKKTATCQTPMCSAGCMPLCNPPEGDAGLPNYSCFSTCPNSAQYAGALICYGP
jgi:hypothetical protein